MPTSILVLWFLSGAACGAIVVREFYAWQRAGLVQRVTYRVFAFFWTAILLSAVAWVILTNETAGGITFLLKIQPLRNGTEKNIQPDSGSAAAKGAHGTNGQAQEASEIYTPE